MHSSARRAFFLGFCTIAVLAITSCKSSRKNENSAVILKPENVVLITLDTVRADHLHCYGDDKIKTPVLDGLAARGALFEKAMAQTPLTQPSHASMFTGTNPNVNHVRDTGGFALQPSSVTLATVLQKHGWNTAGFISATVLKKIFGFGQGFATYDDQLLQSVSDMEIVTRPANVTVDHAISWLNAQPKQPFFVWVHLYDAHEPYNPPAQFRKQYPGDPYDAEIAFEDQQLGRFLHAVYEKSPADNTLVVVLSDHGEGLGQHGEFKHGVFLYDSTVRIAWIMAGPGVPAGVHIQQQAREIDLLPTVLDLLGGKASPAVQGTSLVPAFSGKTVPSTYSYEETLYPKINMGWSELRGIHTAHWMYVRAPKPELYNLDQDPDELNNVIDAHPQEYRELEAQLKKLSRLGNSDTEKVVASQMDQNTMKQLESLGYVSGFSARDIELNGKGLDPKDEVGILQTMNTVDGPGSNKISPAHKIEMLQAALQQDPTNPTLYYLLVDLDEKVGQTQQAMQTCLDALSHNIHSGMIFSRLGNLYLRAGNLKEAAYYYQKATQLNPLDVQGLNDMAVAYLQVGRYADAERGFRWILTVQPYAPAYNGLGILADKQNDAVAARKDFEQAVQIDPTYVEGQLNLGIVCADTHDVPCARKAFRAFLATAPPSYGKEILQVKRGLASLDKGGVGQ
ncbi:MAG: sulfatase-like hydrolase/transferase [Acidobacteriaceae bacterium]